MARRFLAHCFALAALGVCVPALCAQDHLLDELYGRGVHAYFSRNYQDAYKHLSDAMTSGSTDPRVYYFRALADHRLDKPEDAAADLKKAAELEFSGEQPVQVSKALERIQGAERLMIEDVRSKARISIRNVAEEKAKVRYENRVKAEAGVLRKPPAPAGETPPAAPAPGTPDKTDPFGGTPEAPPAVGAKPAVPAGEKPAVPAKPAAEDPFGEAPAKPAAPAGEKPAAAPAKPAAEDPFGEAPAKPAAPAGEKPAAPAGEKPAAETPGEVKPASATEPAAPTGKGSILGSFARAFSKAVPGEAKVAASKPPPAEEAPPPKVDPNTPDPFGDAPAAKPAKAAAPGAKPPAADPFGDDPPAKPAAAPAKPAAAPAKPAAAPAKPGAKPVEDDPFK